MFFVAQDFCWNQLFDLLQSVRMVLGWLRWRRHDFFCCIDFFAGNLFFNFCWNYVNFLLEPCLFFAGTISMCLAGNTSFLLEPHYYLLEPYQLFAGTMCFCFSNWHCYFLLQPTSADGDGEQRAANGGEPAERRGRMGKDRWRSLYFFFYACDAERQGRKRKRTRDLTVRVFYIGWLAADRPKGSAGAPAPSSAPKIYL